MSAAVKDLWADVQPEGSHKLLSAALEAFSVHGFHAATTREIAELAGMSPAGVYVHFRSKAELLFELSRVGHLAVLQEVTAALEGVDEPVERLRRFMQTFVAWHARHHTLARVIQYEIRSIPPERFDALLVLRRQFQSLLKAELERGESAGDFSIEDHETTSLALFSMGIDVARWWTPRSPSEQRLGEDYAELALRMVGARPGG